MKRGWAAVFALAIGMLLPVAPESAAATRYVTPGGSLSDLNCAASQPCNIEHAINTVAQDGDEVVVGTGGYTVSSTLSWSGKSLNVHGQDGQNRPNVIAPVAVVSMQNAAGSTLRHMRLECTSASATLTVNSNSVTVSDMLVVNSVGIISTGTAIGIGVTAQASGVLLRDSVALATGPNSRALLIGGVSGNADATAINVSAYATTPPNSSAILVSANDSGGTHPAALTAKNVIARGTYSDLSVASNGSGAVPATANFAYSNFRPSLLNLQGAAAAFGDLGGNQSAEPLLVNPAGEDFHQLAGSPTIDSGATDRLLGGLDFDGDARVLAAAPDIGADEFTPQAAQPAAPKLTLNGSTRQRVLRQRGVTVRVTCDQACTATASASVSVPGAAKLYRFREATKSIVTGITATLKLTLSKKTLAVIRRALRRGRKLKTKVTVSATTAGLSTTEKRTIRLRR
ncbi:MAG: hypothetical protein HY827_07205 [Actinobacteria bacterium]|nr:hypothetical protein [Actinomycetota bacterium]